MSDNSDRFDHFAAVCRAGIKRKVAEALENSKQLGRKRTRGRCAAGSHAAVCLESRVRHRQGGILFQTWTSDFAHSETLHAEDPRGL